MGNKFECGCKVIGWSDHWDCPKMEYCCIEHSFGVDKEAKKISEGKTRR